MLLVILLPSGKVLRAKHVVEFCPIEAGEDELGHVGGGSALRLRLRDGGLVTVTTPVSVYGRS